MNWKLRLIKAVVPKKQFQFLLFLGVKRFIQYSFAQRVLRINSHVPWPVHWSSVVSHPNKIKRADTLPLLGHHFSCYIQAINGIEIGKNVRYGPNVHIISANHDILDYDVHPKCDPIKIDDHCWIGSGTTILPGVHLGEHVVVAAGSVVNKSFPKNTLIGGVPAKVIRELDPYKGKKEWKP